MLTEDQRDYLLPKAYNAALRAGAVILDIYSQKGNYDIDLKSDKTPITVADREAHNLIKSYLGQTHIPVLSEEGRELLYEERRGWDLFWMVDPLDGTKEFIKGNGEFTVNIALMVDNEPVLSVIYVPYLSKIYFADKPHGSYVRESVKADFAAEFSYRQIMTGAVRLPLRAEANNPLRIAVSRSHNTPDTFAYVNEVKKRFPDAVVIEQGSSYKLCLVAEGNIDYYPRTTHTAEWDTAAGQPIIELAGGRLLTPEGKSLKYNEKTLQNPWFICTSKYMPE